MNIQKNNTVQKELNLTGVAIPEISEMDIIREKYSKIIKTFRIALDKPSRISIKGLSKSQGAFIGFPRRLSDLGLIENIGKHAKGAVWVWIGGEVTPELVEEILLSFKSIGKPFRDVKRAQEAAINKAFKITEPSDLFVPKVTREQIRKANALLQPTDDFHARMTRMEQRRDKKESQKRESLKVAAETTIKTTSIFWGLFKSSTQIKTE